MNPVTGPYVQSVSSGWYWLHKTWYRQKRPYNLNLPFVARKGWTFGPYNTADAWRFASFAESVGASDATSYAQAYAKVVDKLGENAGMGVTLAQWRQADDMIRKRGGQLLQFGRQLARRSPVGVAASLGLSVRETKRIMGTRYGVARKLSDLWLEFWFGWKPAVQDIYTACEVFDNFLPWAHLSGASSRKTEFRQTPETPYGEGILLTGRSACKIGIEVRLVNPNVRLMQQFGILNPAVVAFDAFPWSFVLGWFSNVDSWLSSFTDFAGFETSDGYISKFCYLDGETYWPAYPHTKGGPGRGIYTSRAVVQTLPRPSFQWKELSIKPARALTAISLLTQKLPR